MSIRDKIARRRLVAIESRIDRLESTLKSIVDIIQMNFSTPTFSMCNKCNITLYENYICSDAECPQGFDPE